MRKSSKRTDNEAGKVGTRTVGLGELLMVREPDRLKVSNTAW